MAEIDLIHIANEIHNLIIVNVFIQPAAELCRKIIFSIRKSPRTAKTTHDIARFAIDAVLHLARRDGTGSMINILPALQDNYVETRPLFSQFIGGKRARRARSDNSHIILFHFSAPFPFMMDVPHLVS